jgi:hypothetical protein
MKKLTFILALLLAALFLVLTPTTAEARGHRGYFGQQMRARYSGYYGRQRYYSRPRYYAPLRYLGRPRYYSRPRSYAYLPFYGRLPFFSRAPWSNYGYGYGYAYGYNCPPRPRIRVVRERVAIPVYGWVFDPVSGQYVAVKVDSRWQVIKHKVTWFPQYQCYGYISYYGTFIRVY